VVVWGDPAIRQSLTTMQNLLIDTPVGSQVRLGDIARLSLAPGATAVMHEDGSPCLAVTSAVHGRDVGDVLADVRGRIAGLRLPLEYHAEVSSPLADRQSAELRTLLYALVALLGVLLILQAAFRSWRAAGVVLFAVPFAGVGGVLTAPLAGGVQSTGALAGLAAALALALRGGVLLVAGVRQGGSVPAAARRRVLPVLVTAGVTAAALLPLAVAGSGPGRELLHPLAVTALGGLVTAVFVELYLLPALLLRLAPAVPAAGEEIR
jgi:Cu/Ag efflux pump CusA